MPLRLDPYTRRGGERDLIEAIKVRLARVYCLFAGIFPLAGGEAPAALGGDRPRLPLRPRRTDRGQPPRFPPARFGLDCVHLHYGPDCAAVHPVLLLGGIDPALVVLTRVNEEEALA